MKIVGLTVLCAVLLALGGCNDTSNVVRQVNMGETSAILTSADLRIITERPSPDRMQKVLCAEPSPDVAKALSSLVASQGSVSAPLGHVTITGNASAGRSTSEELAQLTERVPAIQSLRDGLFRACEAYANGAIGANGYALILSRYGDILVTLLLAEAAAGEYGHALIARDPAAPVALPAQPPAVKGAAAEADQKTKLVSDMDGSVLSPPPIMLVAATAPVAKPPVAKPPVAATPAAKTTATDQVVPPSVAPILEAMQKNYLDAAASLTAPLLVVCVNELDPSRPTFNNQKTSELHAICSSVLQAISAQIVLGMQTPAPAATSASRRKTP